MSKVKLKATLKALSKEDVIRIVLDLYGADKEAKAYLDYLIEPDEGAALQKYKDIILNEFYPQKGEGKTRFSVCRKAISDFKKLKPTPEMLADLMLYYIETGVKFTSDYGDMWEEYYTALETNFESTLKHITQNCDKSLYQPRIEAMIKVASDDCGWGFPDTLNELYSEYYGGY